MQLRHKFMECDFGKDIQFFAFRIYCLRFYCTQYNSHTQSSAVYINSSLAAMVDQRLLCSAADLKDTGSVLVTAVAFQLRQNLRGPCIM